MVRHLVYDIDLEVITLSASIMSMRYIRLTNCHVVWLTLLPRIRGPGKTPFITMAARVNPSGAMSALEMVRSVTGPMAAYAETVKRMAVKASKDRIPAMTVACREKD